MARKPTSSIRASFADARHDIASRTTIVDPPPQEKRDGIAAGAWAGAPFDKLPPGCAAVPLGVAGKLSFFMDALGQFISFDGMKPADLVTLFRTTPHFLTWAWPKKTKAGLDEDGNPIFRISGIEEKKAVQCLQKAAADRGPFDPANKLRGRGAWKDDYGRLLWHSGDALWWVNNGKLEASHPGEHHGLFYFRASRIMTPWPEPVAIADSPARAIFDMLTSWSWQRPSLDPVLVLGGIGVMFMSGALKDRPHIAIMGDFGTGKTSLTDLVSSVLGDVLVRSENATEAGVRQYMGLDALPVALDEFEASDDNTRVKKLVDLARISYSGGKTHRGGSDHKGVEFTARNAFFCGGINLPPMGSADLSRFAIVNTTKLDVKGNKPAAEKDWGRQLLRSLMDQWASWPALLADWRSVLANAQLKDRGQDTYGTLFAMAQLMLGAENMEDIGIDITEPQRLGAMIAEATAEERSLQTENWRECLEHLLGAPIEAIKGQHRPTIGGITSDLDVTYKAAEDGNVKPAMEAVALAGCKLFVEDDAALPTGHVRLVLGVPPKGPLLGRIFDRTKYQQGGWYRALKQAPPNVVRPGSKVCKINRASERCLLVDLREYDRLTGGDA